jgi:hypothetical protein
MVERRFCTPEVSSSILLGSTVTKNHNFQKVVIFNSQWARIESDLRHFQENRMWVGKSSAT